MGPELSKQRVSYSGTLNAAPFALLPLLHQPVAKHACQTGQGEQVCLSFLGNPYCEASRLQAQLGLCLGHLFS